MINIILFIIIVYQEFVKIGGAKVIINNLDIQKICAKKLIFFKYGMQKKL